MIIVETETIAKMAEKMSEDIFDFFRWKAVGPYNQNFECKKEERHKPKNKEQAHQHPTDIVFSYLDPYTGKRVYLNTDLKSYGKSSITTKTTRSALKSLSNSVDCARVSEEWKGRYCTFPEREDIRAMLFIYNHDADYKKNFFDHFKPQRQFATKKALATSHVINIDSLDVRANNYIHIIDPDKVNLLSTIVADVQKLSGVKKFPMEDYNFFYPELTLHKQHFPNEKKCSASIEILCSAYIIIHHGNVNDKITKGYLIYYNNKGESPNEFIYFLDTLSKYQIFKDNNYIRIRFTNKKRHKDILSNYDKAIQTYSRMWEFDEEKEKQLRNIEVSTLEQYSTIFSQTEMGWER